MIVTLDEAKEYLRVEYADEDALLGGLLKAAHQICMDVARITDEADFWGGYGAGQGGGHVYGCLSVRTSGGSRPP